ncbi:MAG: hypothetical protein IKV41_06235 [Oscillospiraceae bacterium]|nr:hypothetical protein [Oscillospiraceae bacterium]
MKKLTAFLVGIFTILSLAACNVGQAPSQSLPQADAIIKTAAKLGIYTHAAETGSATTMQLKKQSINNDAADVFTAETPQALENGELQLLAANVPNDDAASEITQFARKKDLPLLFYGAKPNDEILNSWDKIRFVGAGPKEKGTVLGEIALKLWDSNTALDKNNDGVMQYILLDDGSGSAEFAAEVIEQAGVKTSLLAQRLEVKEAAEAAECLRDVFSSQQSQPEMLFCVGDTAVTGAVMAVQGEGFENGEIPIAAWGESAVMKKLADSGVIAGVGIPDSETEAAILLSMTANAAEQRDLLDGLSVDYDPVERIIPVPCRIYEGKVFR